MYPWWYMHKRADWETATYMHCIFLVVLVAWYFYSFGENTFHSRRSVKITFFLFSSKIAFEIYKGVSFWLQKLSLTHELSTFSSYNLQRIISSLHFTYWFTNFRIIPFKNVRSTIMGTLHFCPQIFLFSHFWSKIDAKYVILCQ